MNNTDQQRTGEQASESDAREVGAHRDSTAINHRTVRELPVDTVLTLLKSIYGEQMFTRLLEEYQHTYVAKPRSWVKNAFELVARGDNII